MYHLLYQRVLWPAYEALVKGRKTCNRWHFLEKSQWWDSEQLHLFQTKELTKLLTHLYGNSPYFAEVCRSKGIQQSDIGGKDLLLSLPIMDKDDIRTNLAAMRSKSAQGWTIEKSTGGSTGQPLHFCHDKGSYEWRTAMAYRAYAWAHCEDGRKTVYVWGGAIGEPSKSQTLKLSLHQFLQRRKVFNAFYFDPQKMRECIAFIRKYQPEGVVGFTNPLYSMALLMKKDGLAPLSVGHIVTAAEGVSDDQKALIEEMFGGRVFQTYGSREFMLIGAECECHEGLHLASENLLVEIINKNGRPAAPGEAGEVVVTDLHNYAMPFVRYRTGDMGAMSDKPCSCGRGLPLMKSVVGRKLDILHTLDGREVPGEFFPHLMKEFKAVERFQVVQKKDKRIEVRLAADRLSTDDETRMLSEIRKVIGNTTEVKLCYMDEIPLTPSGKYRVTISEVED